MSKRKRESFEFDYGYDGGYEYDGYDGYGYGYEEEEEPMLGRQTLPVADLPKDFDGVPLDGMQYLFTVRRDARNLPHITRAVNPYEVPDESVVPAQRQKTNTRHPLLPSDEWRMLFEKRFRNFRKNIVQPTIFVDLTPQGSAQRRVMPDKKERDLWWAFLAGRPEAEWDPAKAQKRAKRNVQDRQRSSRMRAFPDDVEEEEERNVSPIAAGAATPQETWHINDEGEVELALRIDPTESLPTPTGSPAPSSCAEAAGQQVNDVNIDVPREPTPALLKLIDSRMCLHLLMYFTHWINVYLQNLELYTSVITESHARWMFALLSRVEESVSADEMNLLRNLARAALGLLKQRLIERRRRGDRDALPEQVGRSGAGTGVPMGESACWLVVTAVVGGWGQRDIWMEAEEMLRGLDVQHGPVILDPEHGD